MVVSWYLWKKQHAICLVPGISNLHNRFRNSTKTVNCSKFCIPGFRQNGGPTSKRLWQICARSTEWKSPLVKPVCTTQCSDCVNPPRGSPCGPYKYFKEGKPFPTQWLFQQFLDTRHFLLLQLNLYVKPKLLCSEVKAVFWALTFLCCRKMAFQQIPLMGKTQGRMTDPPIVDWLNQSPFFYLIRSIENHALSLCFLKKALFCIWSMVWRSKKSAMQASKEKAFL